MELVCNASLREHYLAGIERGVWTSYTIADRAGLHRKGRRGATVDTIRLRRALGVAPHKGRVARRCAARTALRLAEAMGLDAVDIGL